MDKDYLYELSIVIPTKDRQYYCIESLKQIIDATPETVQIVIQDNSSNNKELKLFCQTLDTKRVCYHYNSNTLSFVDNFSEAIEFADGRYVCMIGDDDGVLPSILDALNYALNNDLDCYIPGLNSVYFWPSTHPIVSGGENGCLIISGVKENRREVNVKNEFYKLLNKGFQDYQKIDVPRLYHGLVHKRVLDMIKNSTGSYFGGLTPDMFMVTMLCHYATKVIAVDSPITVSGICPKSGSSASATGKHTGSLSDAPHFIGHDDYVWDNRIPKVYTVETIWAETGLQALKLLDEKNEKKFDQKYLLSRLWAYYPQFHDDILLTAKAYDITAKQLIVKSKAIKLEAFLMRIRRRLSRKKDGFRKYYNVPDMYSASELTENHWGNNSKLIREYF